MPLRGRRGRKAFTGRRLARRKTGGRRTFGAKKFSRRKAASTVVIRQPSGVPDRLFVKLKYTYIVTYTSTSGNVTYQQFRGNGVFDPDVTGAGGQPYTFDQWAALYSRYRVRGSSLKSELNIPPPAAGSFAANITTVTYPSANTTVPSATHELSREQPYAKVRTHKAYGDRSLPIKSYMSTAKIIGLKKVAVATETDYSAAVTGNPTKEWYWNFVFYTSDLATTSFVTPVLHTLTYYVEFYDRARPAVS